MSLNVLFEDNHLLAVVKPAGLLTQPDESGNSSLEEQAKSYIKEKYGKPGAVFLHAVHRLDKPVSGIVLFARTSKALSRMNELQREQKIEKRYIAIIEGQLNSSAGELSHRLSHGSFKAEVGEGKESHLLYRVLKKGKQLSLVEIQLITGRYHQIRAQFSAIEHPIWGDSLYGSEIPAKRLFLHHCDMSFDHPVKGGRVTLHSSQDSWQSLIH